MALVAGIYSVITNNFSDAAKEIVGMFGTAITFVMGFYFNYKGDGGKQAADPTADTTAPDTSAPFAGK